MGTWKQQDRKQEGHVGRDAGKRALALVLTKLGNHATLRIVADALPGHKAHCLDEHKRRPDAHFLSALNPKKWFHWNRVYTTLWVIEAEKMKRRCLQ